MRSTHERIDGAGYPDGLVGEEIPHGSRIILVCAAFAALFADRPHAAARAVPDALAKLRRCAGRISTPGATCRGTGVSLSRLAVAYVGMVSGGFKTIW